MPENQKVGESYNTNAQKKKLPCVIVMVRLYKLFQLAKASWLLKP